MTPLTVYEEAVRARGAYASRMNRNWMHC